LPGSQALFELRAAAISLLVMMFLPLGRLIPTFRKRQVKGLGMARHCERSEAIE
jgi:hypothetical protein